MILHHTDWPRNPEKRSSDGQNWGREFFFFFQGGFGQELQRLGKRNSKTKQKAKKEEEGRTGWRKEEEEEKKRTFSCLSVSLFSNLRVCDASVWSQNLKMKKKSGKRKFFLRPVKRGRRCGPVFFFGRFLQQKDFSRGKTKEKENTQQLKEEIWKMTTDALETTSQPR